MIEPVQLRQPRVIEFGAGSRSTLARHVGPSRRILVVCDAAVRPGIDDVAAALDTTGAAIEWLTDVVPEPPMSEAARLRTAVDAFDPDCIVGIGGGSAIDLAKVLAVLHGSGQDVAAIIGIDAVAGRSVRLIALPTTSGTGSEVTPIAVLTDTEAHLKKGVVSTHLMPDVAIVDPELTRSAPPAVTASTGIDALTHCIEAYTNVHAHPAVDLYALEGIRLIAGAVARAAADGRDMDARTAMALGSLYGGLCLGPVNTAAVHALAYPLGGTFGVPHGVANSMLLPYVMEFNLDHCIGRYAEIARAMATGGGASDADLARSAVERVRALARECGIPTAITAFGVREADLDSMAAAAVQVTRLMSNKPRPVGLADARAIYARALTGRSAAP